MASSYSITTDGQPATRTNHSNASVFPHRCGLQSNPHPDKQGPRARGTFIAVFVCLWSKAAHLEVVSNYTTEAILVAFHFISRRGLCEDMSLDCGINFVGADRTLRELFLLIIRWLLDCTRRCH